MTNKLTEDQKLEKKKAKEEKIAFEKLVPKVHKFLTNLLNSNHSVSVVSIDKTSLEFYLSIWEDFTKTDKKRFVTFEAMKKLSEAFGTVNINLSTEKDYGWYGEADVLQRFYVEDITKWPEEICEHNSMVEI